MAGKRDRYQMEKRYFRKDGRLIWGHLTISVIKDNDGKPRYAISILEDITERKQAEEKLKESEKKFRIIFEGSALGIALFELNSQSITTNPAVKRMLGFGSEELTFELISELTHPEDLESGFKIIQ